MECTVPRTKPALFIADEIRRTWRAIVREGHVTELRVLEAKVEGEWKTGTASGYFNDVEPMIEFLGRCTSFLGAYIVPNEINPALLSRACNRARIIKGKEPTTSDNDIIRRRWLLVDADAVRPSGISSTDEEHELARQRLNAVDNYLWEQGFASGIIADSGNGYHGMYPIDLPANDNGTVEGILKSLAAEFDDEAVKIDTSVHNAARIWRLYGTRACKGDNTPSRPWRISRNVN